VMASTRPFEGLVLTLLLSGAILWFVVRQRRVPLNTWLPRYGSPLAALIILFLFATGVYNHAVTGSAVKLPYTVHEEQYDPAPLFVWQPMRKMPRYRHAEIRDFYLKVVVQPYLAQRTVSGFLASRIDKLSNLLIQYLRPLVLIVLLLALPAAAKRNSWTRFAVIISFLFFVSLLPDVYLSPHYIAPYFCIGCYLLLSSLRLLRVWSWRGKRVGLSLTRLVATSYVVSCIGVFTTQTLEHHMRPAVGWSQSRAHILSKLGRMEGNHLVLVRYGPDHNLHAEWVYNEADIDQARVVWAHDMDKRGNDDLIRYYRGRHVWLLLPDALPVQLIPYKATTP